MQKGFGGSGIPVEVEEGVRGEGETERGEEGGLRVGVRTREAARGGQVQEAAGSSWIIFEEAFDEFGTIDRGGREELLPGQTQKPTL